MLIYTRLIFFRLIRVAPVIWRKEVKEPRAGTGHSNLFSGQNRGFTMDAAAWLVLHHDIEILVEAVEGRGVRL